MNKETFAREHAKICNKMIKANRKGHGGRLSNSKRCGRKLYDYLQKNGLPLDVEFNIKKFNLQ